jgi:hypothetical protein
MNNDQNVGHHTDSVLGDHGVSSSVSVQLHPDNSMEMELMYEQSRSDILASTRGNDLHDAFQRGIDMYTEMTPYGGYKTKIQFEKGGDTLFFSDPWRQKDWDVAVLKQIFTSFGPPNTQLDRVFPHSTCEFVILFHDGPPKE